MALEIENTPEFRRVYYLPRRPPGPPEDLTGTWRTPAGTWRLNETQNRALGELRSCGGLLGPIAVGGGKTLISLLAASAVGARRPLLLLPAALMDKTALDRQNLSKHFMLPRHLRTMSYEALGRVGAANFLLLYKPDLIVADEAHRLKNARAACTKRVARYMSEHPNCKFVALSGTLTKKSVLDFAHLAIWALRDKAPVPTIWGECEEWAQALDESQGWGKMGPGVMGVTKAEARAWFRDRLVSTPGVVAFSGGEVDCSLYIRGLSYGVAPITNEHFKKLRNLWERPDGWALSMATDVWRHARELALGLHYRWKVDPPDHWLQARRDWAHFVRDALGRSRHLDSELQVVHACDAGELDPAWLTHWRSVRGDYEIEPDYEWHDDSALEVCAKWMEKGPGIVWCEHKFFAAELAKRTGAPYFGAGGVGPYGRLIDEENGRRTIIASVAANGTGRNLQMFSRNLITSLSPGPDKFEQLVGRTHRQGQQADQVQVDILCGCAEHQNAWDQMLAGSQAQHDTVGASFRVLTADRMWPDSCLSNEPRFVNTKDR